MDKMPKRRKDKDNPYTLLKEGNNYYVLFDNKIIYYRFFTSFRMTFVFLACISKSCKHLKFMQAY